MKRSDGSSYSCVYVAAGSVSLINSWFFALLATNQQRLYCELFPAATCKPGLLWKTVDLANEQRAERHHRFPFFWFSSSSSLSAVRDLQWRGWRCERSAGGSQSLQVQAGRHTQVGPADHSAPRLGRCRTWRKLCWTLLIKVRGKVFIHSKLILVLLWTKWSIFNSKIQTYWIGSVPLLWKSCCGFIPGSRLGNTCFPWFALLLWCGSVVSETVSKLSLSEEL